MKVRALACVLALTACVSAARADEPVAPELATGLARAAVAVAVPHFGVAAAHPLATRAGLDILRRGGTAVDAAIATVLVLGVVEPQSSGLGGGGFLVAFDAGRGALTSFDGRETAPASARPDRFLKTDGTPLAFMDAVIGPNSVGVPGLVAMLALAHDRLGRLDWARLVEPALRLAEDGFAVSPRLAALIAADPFLAGDGEARRLYFHPDGTPLAAGEIFRNRALADALRLVAAHGPGALAAGPLARAVVRATGGAVTPADLAAYRPLERPVVCGPFRVWRVCGMGPPSSGGIAVAQILALMRGREGNRLDGDFAHAFAEAGRLAFADRDAVVADPAFGPVPVDRLLDPAYLAGRAALIGPTSMGRAAPGLGLADGAATDLPATTHLSVVDAAGNAVALTASVENAFGSRRVVSGFPLNNQLTDFSFSPASVNAVQAGKRPRSAMSPTIVMDASSRPVAVLGSPGGSQIINYVAQALIALLAWDLDPAQAAALAHVGSRNGPTELEQDSAATTLAEDLRRRGHVVRLGAETSGLHILIRRDGQWWGGADPRREGVVLGD